MIRIFLVDDHPVVREGLAAILASEPDFEVVGQAATGERAMRDVPPIRPDVVMVDMRLPGMSGTEACAGLIERHPGLKIILLTSFPNEGVLVSSFTAGARGFLLKESEPSVIRQAVRTVATGGTFVDPRIASKLVALATKGKRVKGPFGLTLAEMRVLELLPRGMTNRQIGGQLGIAEPTVKTHLHNAMAKLGARDRAEAAAIAMREGLA